MFSLIWLMLDSTAQVCSSSEITHSSLNKSSTGARRAFQFRRLTSNLQVQGLYMIIDIIYILLLIPLEISLQMIV